MDAPYFQTLKRSAAGSQMLMGLCALGLIATGLYGSYAGMTSYFLSSAVGVSMVLVGVLLLMCSGAAFVGTFLESQTFFNIQFGMILVLLLVQFALSITSLSAENEATGVQVSERWMYYWQHHPRVIRNTEEEYACCGLTNVLDHAWPKITPRACLESPDLGFQEPCYPKIMEDVTHVYSFMGVLGLLLGGLELISLVPLYMLSTRWPRPVELDDSFLSRYQAILSQQQKPRQSEENEDEEEIDVQIPGQRRVTRAPAIRS